MFYFFKKQLFLDKTKYVFFFIKGLSFLYLPRVGDVLKVFFSKKGSSFFFEGLCFKVMKRKFLLPDSSFSIINKMKGSSISFSFSLFYNLVFALDFSFFKKKSFKFRKAKLFYFIYHKNFLIKD